MNALATIIAALFGLVLFLLILWGSVILLLRPTDRNPHGPAPEPKWREGYDD